jgi:RNA polymerase sigma-70 factor (ECF subfamily)
MIVPFASEREPSCCAGPVSSAEEFETLMRRSYGRAYSVAYRMMGNASDAEDLTQEAFVRIWSAFDRYDRSRSFEGWLFRILTNLAIDRWRRHPGMTACSLDAETHGTAANSGYGYVTGANGSSGPRPSLISCLADERPSVLPEQAYFRAEAGRRVRRALSALPGDYRKVIVLADVQGYSYEEIAARVGCPVGTVRSRLHRGRQLLRQHFLKLQTQEEAQERSEESPRHSGRIPLLPRRSGLSAGVA